MMLQTECIPWWRSEHNKDGYGIAWDWYRRKKVGAHRLIWEECFGPIQDGLCVLHHCDNPRCVNPEHLHLGTPQDNRRECVERNRQTKGEAHYKAKLTLAKVAEIRTRNTEPAAMVAKDYGVHENTIYLIRNGQIWK